MLVRGRVIRSNGRIIAQEFAGLLTAARASGGRIDLRLQLAIGEAEQAIRRILDAGPVSWAQTSRPGRPGESPPHAPGRSGAEPETPIQVLGRADIGQWPDRDEFQSAEVTTPGSSNVYSYFYRVDSPSRKGIVSPGQMGTLFVTFRAWTPGQKTEKGQKGRPFVRGPMYAYSNVPMSKFHQFAAMATGTAGGAVWEYLRVRGTRSGHQHPYRLSSAGSIPGGGVYVPRKATAAGFQRRAALGGRTSQTAWQFSNLPSQQFGKAEPKHSFSEWRRLVTGRNNARAAFGGAGGNGQPNTGAP